uniref:Uncharacterized protein LOC108950530 n=1 Tax=Phallusia mammillata TaxID=59560 RepID=A0A6F9DJZ5_9ASCI|nr:uncharacterized protein LOC108950530 [Phallusia mammillata]
MAPGIQHQAIEWMGFKLKNSQVQERECCLLLDEVQISAAVEYDVGLNQYIGLISPAFQSDNCSTEHMHLATHVLCFMLKGLSTKWKQVVGRKLLTNSCESVLLFNSSTAYYFNAVYQHLRSY